MFQAFFITFNANLGLITNRLQFSRRNQNSGWAKISLFGVWLLTLDVTILKARTI